MKRFLFAPVFAVLLLIGFSLVPTSYADCVPIYGGGQSCTNPNLSIIKTVFNPATNSYVHDLGINDTRFQPGQKVSFKITVTNTGNADATHLVITDFLPSTLLAVAPNADSTNGPAGAVISIPEDSLSPGVSATFTVVGEVVAGIPPGVTCSSNQAKVVSNEDTSGVIDSSQFCVEQPVAPTTTLTNVPTPVATIAPTVFPTTPATTLPPTGPEALPIIALFPTGLTGIILRRIARQMKGGEKI